MSSANEQKNKTDGPVKAPSAHPASIDDDDLYACLLANWGLNDPQTGHPFIPAGRETYMDRYTFFGGVCRHVPGSQVKRWIKVGTIRPEYVFADNATIEDFKQATGRDPLSPKNLAAALQTMTPEQFTMVYGDATAKKFAREIIALVNSRKADEDE